ncbi:unnamed protein product, partial [Brassica rapa]
VWQDRWILNGSIGRPFGPPIEMDQDLMVADLLRRGSNEWNVPKVKSLFPLISKKILSISPSTLGANDAFVWTPTKDGVYSTKPGTEQLSTMKRIHHSSCGPVLCPRCGEKETAEHLILHWFAREHGSRCFDYIPSALVGESLAVRLALSHALSSSFSKVCVFSDCQVLIRELSSKSPPVKLYGISRDIDILSSLFESFSLSFIFRSL